MPAQNQEVQQVVSELKGMNAASSDFSHVSGELRDIQKNDPQHWKQNLETINQSVDMHKLGFPDSFHIAGTTGKGDFVTTSEDGQSLQVRDRTHMSIEKSQPNLDLQSKWGSRTFSENPADGSAQYTVQRGDTLSSIARDILRQQNGGKDVSNASVYNEYQQLAQLNNIDANKLRIGQKLEIPSTDNPSSTIRAQAQPQEYQPSVNADAPALGPQGDVSNPLASPGLGTDDQERGKVMWREQNGTSTDKNGLTTTSYDGQLNSDHLYQGNTDFTAQRTVDAQGHLVSSDVKYGGHLFGQNGTSMQIPDGDGGTRTIQATEVKTDFNRETGEYESTITASDGSTFRANTDSNGKVAGFRQITDAEGMYIPDDPYIKALNFRTTD